MGTSRRNSAYYGVSGGLYLLSTCLFKGHKETRNHTGLASSKLLSVQLVFLATFKTLRFDTLIDSILLDKNEIRLWLYSNFDLKRGYLAS